VCRTTAEEFIGQMLYKVANWFNVQRSVKTCDRGASGVIADDAETRLPFATVL
jgi:hypothetical protein